MEGLTRRPAPAVRLRWRLLLPVLGRLPQGMLSRLTGRLADIRIPRWLRRPVLGLAVAVLGIDTSEAELPLHHYSSLGGLFVRRLRPGVRDVAPDPDIAVSPVDGIVGELGPIDRGRLLQVKGRSYRVAALLADEELASRYEGGVFATLYLSPRHYHRIHAPCDGAIVAARHVSGALLPVNMPALLLTPDLFVGNERLICHISGPLGRVAVVAVGAFNVGRISAAFDPEWNHPTGGVTNRRHGTSGVRAYDPPTSVRRGEEIMAFHLGSTVVVLFESGKVELSPELAPGTEIRLGRPVARSS